MDDVLPVYTQLRPPLDPHLKAVLVGGERLPGEDRSVEPEAELTVVLTWPHVHVVLELYRVALQTTAVQPNYLAHCACFGHADVQFGHERTCDLNHLIYRF